MTTTRADPAALLAARAAAQQLTVQQKVQLISELANEIAQVVVPTGSESAAVGEQATHRALWAQLQNSMRDLPDGRHTHAATARLSVQEKAQLSNELVQEIAQAAMPTPAVAEQPHPGDPAALLAAVRERVAAIPARRTLGEQLEADRHERDMLLRGREETRVHE